MAEEARRSIHIGAAPERCFATVSDFERYPQWASDVKAVSVLARDGDGRGTRVRYEVSALGRAIGYVLDYDFAGAPGVLSWTFVEGDLLRRLDGSYRFEPSAAAGTDGTDVTYALTIDLALPLPGFIKRQATQRILDNAMSELKQHLERGR